MTALASSTNTTTLKRDPLLGLGNNSFYVPPWLLRTQLSAAFVSPLDRLHLHLHKPRIIAGSWIQELDSLKEFNDFYE